MTRCSCIGVLERDYRLRLTWHVIVADPDCPFPHETVEHTEGVTT